MKLLKPITFDGDEVTDLNFDFDTLTGLDLINAESRLRKLLADKGEMLMAPEMDTRYLAMLAAQAAGVPVEQIYALKAPDFSRVIGDVRNFLMGAQPAEPSAD